MFVISTQQLEQKSTKSLAACQNPSLINLGVPGWLRGWTPALHLAPGANLAAQMSNSMTKNQGQYDGRGMMSRRAAQPLAGTLWARWPLQAPPLIYVPNKHVGPGLNVQAPQFFVWIPPGWQWQWHQIEKGSNMSPYIKVPSCCSFFPPMIRSRGKRSVIWWHPSWFLEHFWKPLSLYKIYEALMPLLPQLIPPTHCSHILWCLPFLNLFFGTTACYQVPNLSKQSGLTATLSTFLFLW